jgi:hypothetical protein
MALHDRCVQVDIPVQTDKELLPYDENMLAICKRRLFVIPSSNRWYPVLERYISHPSDDLTAPDTTPMS